jgi:hypothetical protein
VIQFDQSVCRDLDVASHRPDMPVLPNGPYIGLGLWNSVAATLIVEAAIFHDLPVQYLQEIFKPPQMLF